MNNLFGLYILENYANEIYISTFNFISYYCDAGRTNKQIPKRQLIMVLIVNGNLDVGGRGYK